MGVGGGEYLCSRSVEDLMLLLNENTKQFNSYTDFTPKHPITTSQLRPNTKKLLINMS